MNDKNKKKVQPKKQTKMSQIVKLVASKQPATHALIFLHGLGDSGHGWSFLGQHLQAMDPIAFQSTTFIFPTAPTIGITANGGHPMNAWFDLMEWDPEMRQFDNAGYLKTLNSVVKDYVKHAMDEGIPAENIILGGFSQGAAIALGSAISLPWKLGGFISLSGFISCHKELFVKLDKDLHNKDTPIFHGHGDADPVVAVSRGKGSLDWIIGTYGFQKAEFHTYKGLQHSADEQELRDVYQFVKKCWNL